MQAIAKATKGTLINDIGIKSYDAHFFVMTKNQETINYLSEKGWTKTNKRDGVKLWTDTYSNIVSVLENRTRKMRLGPKKQE